MQTKNSLLLSHGQLANYNAVISADFADELTTCDTSHTLYEFCRNFPEVRSTVVHFQLRNLIWATSCHDMFVVHTNRIVHWNMLTGDSAVVLDLTGTKPDSLAKAMGVVHISTSCVKGSLAAAGAPHRCSHFVSGYGVVYSCACTCKCVRIHEQAPFFLEYSCSAAVYDPVGKFDACIPVYLNLW